MPGKIIFKIAKNIAFLLVGIALLYFAFRGNDMHKLVDDLKHAKYSWVFLSLILGICAYISRGLRWLILLEPMGFRPKISTSIYSVIIGYFANLAVPRIGELTRCTTLNQSEKIPVNVLFGTVILERIIDMVILLLLTLITILLKVDLFGGFFLDLINDNREKYPQLLKLLVFLTISAVLFFVMFYTFRSRFTHYPFVTHIHSFIKGLKKGLLSLKEINNHPMFWFHTIIIWSLYYLMSWIVFYAIPETSHLGAIDGLFILVVAGYGMAAPVQGGIGAYHFIVSLGLGVLGIEPTAALSYATIVHTSQTILVLIAGSISMGLVYLNLRKIKLTSIKS